jgi:hypothetical protein
MRTKFIAITTLGLLGALALGSCSSEKKGSHKSRQPEESGTLKLNVQTISTADSFDAANSTASTSTDAAPGSLALGLDLRPQTLFALGTGLRLTEAFPTATRWSITSGPPDAFSVTIASMQLVAVGEGGKSTSDNVTDLIDEPVTISVDSGTLNLSALLSATKDLRVPAGTYGEFRVSFKRKAQIKGCVSGVFDSLDATDGAQVDGAQTYCTRADYSVFDDRVTTNADFQVSTTPEMMDFSLGMNKDGTITNDTFTIIFSLTDRLVV